jgi:RNA 2',3'-cyclic 3'-phosphodiesterase
MNMDSTKQFALPGFDPMPAPLAQSEKELPYQQRAPNTLFFAIFPDSTSAARITKLAFSLRDAHSLSGALVKASRLHVTLHDLGGYASLPRDIVDSAIKAATAVSMPSFDIVFDRALSFSRRPGNKAFVLRSAESNAALAAFRQSLGVAMMNVGLRATRSFTPHMTLLYDRQGVVEQAIEPLAWTANEFALVYSHVGEGVHESLGRWPLQATPQ